MLVFRMVLQDVRQPVRVLAAVLFTMMAWPLLLQNHCFPLGVAIILTLHRVTFCCTLHNDGLAVCVSESVHFLRFYKRFDTP